MLEIVGERGFAGCSVEEVTARARMSRRTFYEEFDDLRDCFIALLDLGAGRVIGLVAESFAGRESWLEGLRCALASLLVLLEEEPLLARVWLVESMAAGGWALEHRERRLNDLLRLIRDAWPLPPSSEPRPLVVEGVFASVRSIVTQRVLSAGENESGSLIELLGPLMGLIAAPFVDGSVVELEVRSAEELASAIAGGDRGGIVWHRTPEDDREAALSGWSDRVVRDLPGLLANPSAHRARHCVLFLAENPASSNSEIAAAVGIAHKAQISTLLRRLERQSLLIRTACEPGKRNAWRLSAVGESAAAVLRGIPPAALT